MIAGLAHERSDTVGDGPVENVPAEDESGKNGSGGKSVVLPLRRKWPAALLAAATVAVIGFGVTQVVGNQSSPDSATSGSDATTARDQEQDESGEGAPSEPKGTEQDSPGRTAAGITELDQIPGLEVAPGSPTYSTQQGTDSLLATEQQCGPTSPVAGTLFSPATYKGRTALVVLLPTTSATQQVEVYVCGRDGGRVVERATIATTP